MSNSFAELKRSRKDSFKSLLEETKKISNVTRTVDTRFWKPEVDKAGNGYAIIRFLPAPEGESIPYVRIFNHGFQGPGGWYIENSLTTLGQKDPVSEYNSMLWNSGIEANKDIARKQKRRLTYISNIYVVKDPANPENEGKVFLYRYGKKIHDMLEDKMTPQFEDETPMNPFDLWTGANFRLKIRNVEGYRNYDKSEFDSSAALLEDDDALEMIWKSEYSLTEFVDPSQFKSYDELKAKLDRVLDLSDQSRTNVTARAEDTVLDSSPEPQLRSTPEPTSSSTTDDDDDLDFFKSLAEDEDEPF